jgi:hypothetical protein
MFFLNFSKGYLGLDYGLSSDTRHYKIQKKMKGVCGAGFDLNTTQ